MIKIHFIILTILSESDKAEIRRGVLFRQIPIYRKCLNDLYRSVAQTISKAEQVKILAGVSGVFEHGS
jgi:hypothetical protein